MLPIYEKGIKRNITKSKYNIFATFWLIFIVSYFFYLRFLSWTLTRHRTVRKGGDPYFYFCLPLLPTSQTLRHYPDNYCSDSVIFDKTPWYEPCEIKLIYGVFSGPNTGKCGKTPYWDTSRSEKPMQAIKFDEIGCKSPCTPSVESK